MIGAFFESPVFLATPRKRLACQRYGNWSST